MIPQRNLTLLSNRLARAGGRRIPESVLERDYCLAWFLVGLARAPLRELLVFKGGTALKRCYFGDYRFSEDLDFTLTGDVPFETTRKELDPIFEEVRRASGIAFRFERQDRAPHANSHTFYLGYEGPLPARSASQVKVDITIREKMVRKVANVTVLRGYHEYDDLPDDAILRVYALEEIAVETIVALGDRARNEPRDLYDLWYLTSEGHVDLAHLRADVEAKLDFRSKNLPELAGEFKKKEPRLKALWDKRLAPQMAELPEFEGVFRSVQRALRQANLVE